MAWLGKVQPKRIGTRRFDGGCPVVWPVMTGVKWRHRVLISIRSTTRVRVRFMDLAADALEIADATRNDPVPYEGPREIYLPEYEFRGRDNRRIQYAILTSAAVRGGLEPDLLDEVTWWRADDYWRYALFAAVALIRAGAERRSVTMAQMVEQLADRTGVTLA